MTTEPLQAKQGFSPLSRSERIGLAVLAVAAGLALYAGWRLFWYLTDDAFIFFRYASNSLLGHGYVWNAAPFRPVEGYTSFLWLVLLDAVWRLTRIAPPDAANWLSLLFSGLSLALFVLMVMRLPWEQRLLRFRVWFAALGLLGTLSNTTFLAWTSSGLETALFDLCILLWLYSLLYLPAGSRLWAAGLSVSALLLYLSRPDGLLFAAATLLALGAAWKSLRLPLVEALPLLGIPIHLVWRRIYYGDWLPNTYYAKVVPGRIWWESGWRYLLSFVIEYGLWLWLAVMLVYLALLARRWLRRRPASAPDVPALLVLLAVLTLLGHFAYYTFGVGGDHFEYRVYSHLVPLLFLSLAAVLNHLRLRPAAALLLLAACVAFSWPVQWLNWSLAERAPRDAKGQSVRPWLSDSVQQAVPAAPAPVLAYLHGYDVLQAWLSEHYVCVRQQSSRALTQHLLEIFPSREQGLAMDSSSYPVATQEAVGVLSWVLPRANIIDLLGLNDYVIARNPDLKGNERMAHERQAPEGYVDCLEPNLIIRYKKIMYRPRPVELSAQKIVLCEQTFARMVGH